MLKKIACWLGLVFTLHGFGFSRAPLVFVVSGGFGTCADHTHLEMQRHLFAFARRAHQDGYPVKFILTCFSGLREDMEYYSIDNYSGTGARQVIHGGKDFEREFHSRFLNGYLNNEIPPGARVFLAGQSHGGWVSLSIAASRPVDFVATLDPISRTECSFKDVAGLRFLRNLRSGLCNQPTSRSLLSAVEQRLAMSRGVALNLFQTASILHSGPFRSPWIRDIDFGRLKPEYEGSAGHRALNAKAHKHLAVDDNAWTGILTQMERKMASLDPEWKTPVSPEIAMHYRAQSEPATHLY